MGCEGAAGEIPPGIFFGGKEEGLERWDGKDKQSQHVLGDISRMFFLPTLLSCGVKGFPGGNEGMGSAPACLGSSPGSAGMQSSFFTCELPKELGGWEAGEGGSCEVLGVCAMGGLSLDSPGAVVPLERLRHSGFLWRCLIAAPGFAQQDSLREQGIHPAELLPPSLFPPLSWGRMCPAVFQRLGCVHEQLC